MKSAPHEFVHGKTFWLSCAVCGMERNATPLHDQPPLNPDAHALRKAVEAVHNETCGAHGDLAHIAVNAYVHALAPAQPEVTKWQELRALPVGTLIIDGEGQLMRVIGTYGSGRSKFEAVEEDWACDDRSIPLPARVLDRPSGGGHDGH